MMISTQTICGSSSRIPQPAGIHAKSPVSLSPWKRRGGLQRSSGFGKGRGSSSTWAIKPASSFFSSAEDASADGVHARETGVRDFSAGTELMDPISPTKFVSTVDDQLPPLLSMVIDGLPPLEPSKYLHEAEKRMHEYAKRYQNVNSLVSYSRLGLSAASYIHFGVISVDRLVAIATFYTLWAVLDDFFFDKTNDFRREQYGFGCDASESPQKIQEYLDHLHALFSQQVQPDNTATLIEILMWESGRDLLELSNPEWFRFFIASFVEHHRVSIASLADVVQGQNLGFQDLESFTVMRAINVGGFCLQLLVEFANDSYIPSTLRVNPYFGKATMAASIHIGFVNDVFSYHRESLIEEKPRNVINVLMECEGKPFVETVRRAIGLVNTYAHAIMDVEAEAWNSTLQNHLQNIKAIIAGNFYYNFMEKRYRHPDSFFPELRDKNSSLEFLPHVKGLGL